MLYHLLPQFADVHIVFNLFNYLTFRSAGAVITALLIALVAGPATIRWLRHLRVGQVIRTEGPQSHLKKAGTPTMGGTLILLAATISTLLWAEITNWYVMLSLLALLWMGAIGFMDDYLKVVQGRPRGLVARYKMVGQLSFGLLLGIFLVLQPIHPVPPTWTMVPFFDQWVAVFWVPAYVVFVSLVVSGSSNAVNLTDGLDGLAAGLGAIALVTFGVFAYLIGRVDTSAYLGLFYLPGAGELAVFAAALAGGAVGFLWYNAPPAEVFMGDTGSLALGGALAVMAILLKAEFLLLIVGGVFVLEALSVMLQVGWFKYTSRRFGAGRRIFLMAPIHHHFEKLGWAETKVVVRFWILGILFAMLAFSTLKIR
ncbi:MAG: phospho-N-acetylmuramoyl-pentapeptide-transferase [Gemmatimonadales bacterium]|nr:MAG: phospho-N-acetylmuramoyl-pentapeptide-transferase [Gemmatimonadales bacterium]